MIWPRDLFRRRKSQTPPTFEEYSLLAARARDRPGFLPETGPEIHSDLFRYLTEQRGRGAGIIEVGCFKGASSILFAYLCDKYGWPFYSLDITPEYLEYTRKLLHELGLGSGGRFFLGSLEKFGRETRLAERPALVFIDANHSYPEVVKDIRALYELNRRPRAVAFHDFSLRSSNPADGRIFVDRAIFDCFGNGVEYRRIGQQFGENPVPSAESPSPAGAYWERNGSEGVLIELDGRELSSP